MSTRFRLLELPLTTIFCPARCRLFSSSMAKTSCNRSCDPSSTYGGGGGSTSGRGEDTRSFVGFARGLGGFVDAAVGVGAGAVAGAGAGEATEDLVPPTLSLMMGFAVGAGGGATGAGENLLCGTGGNTLGGLGALGGG